MLITIAADLWSEYTKKVRLTKSQNCFVISMLFDIRSLTWAKKNSGEKAIQKVDPYSNN